MNKTKIDWCDMSWNPVTGCYHYCKYCYAKSIANRFGGYSMSENCGYAPDCKKDSCKNCKTYSQAEKIHYLNNPVYTYYLRKKIEPYPYYFEPTFHEYRLDEPVNKTKGKTIFVCSMADLFGVWVPDEWLVKIFKIVEKCPQHKFIFLTKNANRFMKLYKNGLNYILNYENAYFGVTITDYKEESKIHYLSFISDQERRFVSAEPFLNCITDNPFELKYANKSLPGKIIIGAMTGNNIIQPNIKDLKALINMCKIKKISIFMKNNLKKYWNGEFIQKGF